MVKIQGFYNAVFKMPLVLYKPQWYLVYKFSIITNDIRIRILRLEHWVIFSGYSYIQKLYRQFFLNGRFLQYFCEQNQINSD